MPELVPMPKLGFDMAEGTLVRKVKQPGQNVNKGEVLAEIETDKATVEVESPASGVVKGWLVEEGQAVPVGALMAVIGAPDEQVDLDALRQAAPAAASSDAATLAQAQPAAPGAAASKRDNHGDGATAPAKAASAPGAQAAASEPAAPSAPETAPTQTAASAPPAAPSGATAPVSPIARKMAAEAGIDVGQITGTGPGGRITKKDVEAYQRQPATAAAPVPPSVQAPTLPVAAHEDQTVALTRMRQAIARRMTESFQTVPQFYLNTEIDMTAAMQLRQQLNELLPDDGKLSVNDLIIKAAALALREYPNLNASFAGDKVIRKGHINVGNAVALEAGLLTVVVRDAEQKPLAKIAAEMKAMVARVREGKVQSADIEGSTFSISNLGKYDVEHFVAIINPPEAAILATGTVKQAPVVRDGAVVAGLRLMATLSADHRVTDGAEAAQFMQSEKQKLEQPLRLVL